MKSIPGGARHASASQSSGMSRVNPGMAEAYLQNSYRNSYGPFLPRPARTFSEGAFGPMPPIQPVPVDEPPLGGQYPDPRLWQYRVGWNLPTPPGTEGLKLAGFDQLKTLSERYCLHADTRILCSDFIWRPLTAATCGVWANEIVVGSPGLRHQHNIPDVEVTG